MSRKALTLSFLVCNGLEGKVRDWLFTNVNPSFKVLDKSKWQGRRMLHKIEWLEDLILGLSVKKNDQFIMVDADLYFCGDPFTAFEREFDLGITSRFVLHRFPVNGGVVFFRPFDRVKKFINMWIEQICNPTWEGLLEIAILRKWPDWFCDQDMLHFMYHYRSQFEILTGLKVVDLGYEYNYFSDVDIQGDWKQLMINAYESRTYKVLHFKGDDLKALVKEDWFTDYQRVLE